MRLFRSIAVVSSTILPFAACAQQVTLEVKDITPKFVGFYEAASKPGVDEAERWKLWKTMYDFAAVPPTPEGDKMARTMLDEAWPKFGAALPLIRRGIAAIDPPPEKTLRQVAKLLDADVPVRVRLIVAVGDFEGNAYTFPGKDGVPTVATEVEDPKAGQILTHEFTHAVEAEQAGISLDWKRSIAHTIFAEGLAMRAVQAIHPGMMDAEYVGEFSPHWLERCKAKQAAILADVNPHLGADDSDTVMLYTIGKGGVGVEREAYFAGWLVIGDLLHQGWTFPRLARVQERDMVSLVGESLKRLQHGGKSG